MISSPFDLVIWSFNIFIASLPLGATMIVLGAAYIRIRKGLQAQDGIEERIRSAVDAAMKEKGK